MNGEVTIHQNKYIVLSLLGRGKGGYSYLVESNGKKYVLKKIHYEPCDYYSFGNKIEAEINDYNKLLKTGINLPRMIDIDISNEIIIKEYIEGPTVFELIKNDIDVKQYIIQVKEMASILYSFELNIDYFPTNFVVKNNVIYYIDYECNKYMEEWNFENWGIKYWSKTKEFIEYLDKVYKE